MESEVIYLTYDTFTAANSQKGFFSYFDEVVHGEDINRVYLIKGGPGSGKSTFMKKVAKDAGEKKFTIERILCSSDPKSLDGVIVKDRGIAIIDATSPHAFDMKYPGACESLIDLSAFWDIKKLSAHKREIKGLFMEISARYKGIYNLLKAAGEVCTWKSNLMLTHFDSQKASAYVRKLIKQNGIAPIDSVPKTENRLLAAIGGDGATVLSNTVNSLCDGYVVICDKLSVSGILISKAAAYFNKSGYDTICFHSPLDPEGKPTDLIIPSLRLGFITSGNIFSPTLEEEKIIKSINTKSFIDSEFYKQNKQKISFAKKLEKELIQEAAAGISDIKRLHDELERYYIQAMDYEALDSYTESFINNY